MTSRWTDDSNQAKQNNDSKQNKKSIDNKKSEEEIKKGVPLIEIDMKDKIGNALRQKYIEKIYEKMIIIYNSDIQAASMHSKVYHLEFKYYNIIRVMCMKSEIVQREEEKIYKEATNKVIYQNLTAMLIRKLTNTPTVDKNRIDLEMKPAEEKMTSETSSVPAIVIKGTPIQPASYYLLDKLQLEMLDFPQPSVSCHNIIIHINIIFISISLFISYHIIIHITSLFVSYHYSYHIIIHQIT